MALLIILLISNWKASVLYCRSYDIHTLVIYDAFIAKLSTEMNGSSTILPLWYHFLFSLPTLDQALHRGIPNSAKHKSLQLIPGTLNRVLRAYLYNLTNSLESAWNQYSHPYNTTHITAVKKRKKKIYIKRQFTVKNAFFFGGGRVGAVSGMRYFYLENYVNLMTCLTTALACAFNTVDTDPSTGKGATRCT